MGDRMEAQEGGLPIHEALQVAEGLTLALEAAHRNGIVHRDVKPSNVMRTEGGVVKLMDFGIASTSDPSKSTLVVGTPHYMAPEQFIGKGIDHRTDIFAMGATLYELLTGTPPFLGGERGVEPPRPRRVRVEVPIVLDKLVMRCLSVDPQERPQSVSEMLPILRELRNRTESEAVMDAIELSPISSPAPEPITPPSEDPDSIVELLEEVEDRPAKEPDKVDPRRSERVHLKKARRPESLAEDSDFGVTVSLETDAQELFLAKALDLEPDTLPPVEDPEEEAPPALRTSTNPLGSSGGEVGVPAGTDLSTLLGAPAGDQPARPLGPTTQDQLKAFLESRETAARSPSPQSEDDGSQNQGDEEQQNIEDMLSDYLND